MALVCLAGTEDCRRPFGFVGAVGIVLGLKADACALVIDFVVLACDSAVEEVAGVDLNAGLIGVDIKHDACRGRLESGGGDSDIVLVSSTQLWS